MHRFYVPDLPHEGALVALSDEEARHLTQVLRLALGDEVRCSTGTAASTWRASRWRPGSAPRCASGAAGRGGAGAALRLTLAAALLKGDKFDDVVRDAAMLGVHVVCRW